LGEQFKVAKRTMPEIKRRRQRSLLTNAADTIQIVAGAAFPVSALVATSLGSASCAGIGQQNS
jgi:hypothetical protein